jgi:hypothetical protein
VSQSAVFRDVHDTSCLHPTPKDCSSAATSIMTVPARQVLEEAMKGLRSAGALLLPLRQ